MNNPSASKPRVWLVIGEKLGDNAQATLIADNLGIAYKTRRLLPKQQYILGKPRFRASLDHLDPEQSDPLTPPWPDLVITIGRRHAMAALWIKAQNPATRIVLLGRPRRWIEKFDLVIAPPQYRIPDTPNVMRLNFPIMRPDKIKVAEQAEYWREKLKDLERPIIAVLVGGPTRPYRFDRDTASRLIENCRRIQARYGGTLYFSTSRRTPEKIVSTLAAERPDGSILHKWEKHAPENPYLALLQLADYFVVTGDSVSMMVEVADCGKPLAIYPLPGDWRGRLWQKIQLRLHDNRKHGLIHSVYRRLGGWLYSTGTAGFGRDLVALQKMLIDSGFAVTAGQPFKKPTQPLPDELHAIKSRIMQLIG